jgi:hypothetical protein
VQLRKPLHNQLKRRQRKPQPRPQTILTLSNRPP